MGAIDVYPVASGAGPTTLAYGSVTSGPTIGTTETDIPGCTVTVTVPAGRRLRITGRLAISSPTVANNEIAIFIQEDGVRKQHDVRRVINVGDANMFHIEYITSPSAGTHTYKLTGLVSVGAGLFTVATASDRLGFILVEDVTGSQLSVLPTSVPVGLLAQAQINSTWTLGATGTATLVPGLSANVVVPAGRTLKITAVVHGRSSVATDATYIGIQEDGIGKGFAYVNESNTTESSTSPLILLTSPTAGAHTYAVIIQRQNGTGSVSVYADSVSPSFIMIEDITATPAPAIGAPSATLAYAETTTPQTGITTAVDLTGLSTTVTVGAGRRLRISALTLPNSSVAGDQIECYIYEDGVRKATASGNSTGGNAVTLEPFYITSPSAGTHTYKLVMTRYSGTGSVNNNAGSGFPSYILVEDITAATVTPVATGPNQFMPITLGYAEVTSNQGSITTTQTDITGLSVTVNVPAGRRLRISARTYWTSTTSDGDAYAAIFEGSTSLQETRGFVGGTSQPLVADPTVIISPSAGSHTYKVVAKRLTGTGTLTNNGNTQFPSYILVEDITGSGLPVANEAVPVGVLAQTTYAGSNVTLANFPTLTTIPGFSINFTVPAGRTVKLSGWILAFSSVSAAGEVTGYTIQDNGVNVGNLAYVTGPNWGAASAFEFIYSPSAGSHTITVQARRDTGTGTHTFQSGIIVAEDVSPTPASASNFPSSTLATNTVTAQQTGISTEQTLTGLSVTVTVAAGRRLRISGGGQVGNDATAGFALGHIKQDGTAIGRWISESIGASTWIKSEGSAIVSPSAGTHTYTLSLLKFSGAGAIYLDAASTFPAYILVEDITGSGIAGHTHSELDDTGWLPLPVLNSWVSYDNTYGPAGYRKKAGIVYLRGLVKNGTSGSAIIAQLPPGFRPGLEKLRVNGQSNELFCQYDIQGSTGYIIPVTGVNTIWTSLNNISFTADQ